MSQFWDDCPKGAINTMVRRTFDSRRRRAIFVAAIASLVISWPCAVCSLRSGGEATTVGPQSIDCEQAATMLDDFVGEKLEPVAACQMRRHFAECPACRNEFFPRCPTYCSAFAR